MMNTQPTLSFSTRHLLLVALFLCASLASFHAHAGLLTQVGDMLSVNTTDDESISMLRMLLGNFALNPFGTSDGASGNILGEMFKKYNIFIFATAMIWFTYNAIAGLAQTMHEGVVLGRRMSTVWFPIRVTFGAASLMPIFGGWAFCQALMVIAALLGIAGANQVAKTAIDSMDSFQTLVNPQGMVKNANNIRGIEANMLKAAGCMRADEAKAAEEFKVQYTATAPIVLQPKFLMSSDQTAMTITFPSRNYDSGCGSILLQFSPRKDTGLGSMMGFRINGVKYEQIRKQSMAAHQATLRKVWGMAQTVSTGATVEASDAQIAAATALVHSGYFSSYTTLFQQELAALTASTNASANMSAISNELREQMGKGGWATLGIWYAVFAETNEAMNEMLDPAVTFDEPKEINSSHQADWNFSMDGIIAKAKSTLENASTALTNQVGSVSLGQAIIGTAITGLGQSSGDSKVVNPIIAYKNIGDNALSIAITIYTATKFVEAMDDKSAKKKETSLGNETSSFGLGKMAKGLIGTITGIASDAAGLMIFLSFILFATAASMALYIPMIPFIQWFAALLQWFTSVLESLLGASLWALSHFDSDGEGMGQRTSYGYLYMINNFARPIIMTFAFFMSSAAVTILGTFLFRYFGSAIASAQGTSITGIVSIVGYLVIFAVLGIILINSAFSIGLSLADRLITWVGHNAGQAIGNDVENRVSGMFIAAARAGTQTGKMAGFSSGNKGLVDSVGAGKGERSPQ
jgi:conjugal transfer/type IV secretion protein DotA/TraY